jgi:hypothetical protein
MWVRLAVCTALIALGYYLGREIGRAECVRDQLRRAEARRRRAMEASEAQPGVAAGPGPGPGGAGTE